MTTSNSISVNALRVLTGDFEPTTLTPEDGQRSGSPCLKMGKLKFNQS
jgi:hypothetical protein